MINFYSALFSEFASYERIIIVSLFLTNHYICQVLQPLVANELKMSLFTIVINMYYIKVVISQSRVSTFAPRIITVCLLI